MREYYETASNDAKNFDWSKLPPGTYESKNGTLVRVDGDSIVHSDAAADSFKEALNRLVTKWGS